MVCHSIAVDLEGRREAAVKDGGIKAAMAAVVTVQQTAFMAAMHCMYWLIKKRDGAHHKLQVAAGPLQGSWMFLLRCLINVSWNANYTSERGIALTGY